ncbi:sorting nexin-22 [Trichomycterus rosablanca]|uniref:sorting nexin-22 n=1 Tax=Trichomycterus rosablanca TaxID=2290929 RepID=UPI002F353E74
MIEVSIPSVEKEVDQSGKTRKLYRVEVLFNGRKHFVMRRQSEFQEIHQKLKKILQPPSFPSKRNQNLRTKPLEQRRQELENYLQVLLYQNEEVPQELLDFLQLKHFHSANKICSFHEEHLKEQGHSCKLWHQRVVGFSCDPYLLTSDSDLPDVVVAGVLQGLFPKDTKVSFSTCSKPSVTSRSRQPSVPSIVIDRVSLSPLPETERTQETGSISIFNCNKATCF